jgi:DNA-binding transcriptional LysR family regulator
VLNRFDELSALVAVVEHGSFSAAAERPDIAKSAVSRRVADLEARLGVRLLNRTTRRLHLTEPGRVLHERTVQLLADWAEAEQMVSAEGTRLSGPLKISTALSFGLRHLDPVVAEFARAHPDVQLEVDLSDREVDLVCQGFDLAVRIGKLADSTLVAKRLTMIDLRDGSLRPRASQSTVRTDRCSIPRVAGDPGDGRRGRSRGDQCALTISR